MLELVAIVSLFNTSLIICLYKWKIFDMYEIYREEYLPKMCYFCLAFWLGILEVLIVHRGLGADNFIIPFCAAAITNFFSNIAIEHENR